MSERKQYKIAFTSLLSVEGLYSQITIDDLKRIPALTVLDIDSHPGLADFARDTRALITVLLESCPDFIVTYNDTTFSHTKLSLLLGIPKIRVQDDDPANIKWRTSYLYDTESPLTVISTSSTAFQASQYHRRLQDILSDTENGKGHGGVWQCASFGIPNKFGIKDLLHKKKDIDIVFIGDVGGITVENMYRYLEGLAPDTPGEALEDLYGMLTGLSCSWKVEQKGAFPVDECTPLHEILLKYDITGDKRNKIWNGVLSVALPSVRRTSVLKGLINRFGHEYTIKLYGGYQLAKDISSAHYGGMAFGDKKEDVFRRSKIQVHIHNNLQYNAARMLESYRYACLCLSNRCVNEALYEAAADIAGGSIPSIPKFQNIDELYDLCEHYLQNEKERVDAVEKVLSLIPKETDASERVNAYIRFFDNVKKMDLKVDPFGFAMLRYDYEVIELCKMIEDCCLELGMAEKSAYYRRLKEHFIGVLESGYKKKPEYALQYSHYQFKSAGNFQKASEVIDTCCKGLEGAKVLRGKLLILQGNLQETAEVLSSFSCEIVENESYRLCYLAAAYQSLGDHASALDAMLKVLDLEYPMPHINYYIGFSYFSLKDFDKAKEYLLVNTGIERLFLPAFELLGDICFEKLGDFVTAYDAYNTAGGIASKLPENERTERCIYFLDKMALCKLHGGDPDEAVTHLNIIIEKFDSRHVNSHMRLFYLLLAANEKRELLNKVASFIINNRIDVKMFYRRIRPDFPEEFAKLVDKALESVQQGI